MLKSYTKYSFCLFITTLFLFCSSSRTLSQSEENHEISAWEELISFRPPTRIQEETLKYRYRRPLPLRGQNVWVNWYVQRIENGDGPINLDYYPVEIEKLPVIDGKRVEPSELLKYIRLHINDFIDTSKSTFEPYNQYWAKRWFSEDESTILGCYVHIRMLLIPPPSYASEIPIVKSGIGESGTVVVSDISEKKWIFSTVFSRGHGDSPFEPGDFLHPVSGNREFGWKQKSNSKTFIFYTKGADRISGNNFYKAPLVFLTHDKVAMLIFGSADRLWLSYQDKVADFVNRNSGIAFKGKRVSMRENWADVKSEYHNPTIDWVELENIDQ